MDNVTGKRSIGEGSEMQTSMIEKKQNKLLARIKETRHGLDNLNDLEELHRITNCIEGMRCDISYREKHLTHRQKMDLEKA